MPTGLIALTVNMPASWLLRVFSLFVMRSRTVSLTDACFGAVIKDAVFSTQLWYVDITAFKGL